MQTKATRLDLAIRQSVSREEVADAYGALADELAAMLNGIRVILAAS